jgi:hypothetical protein
VGSLALVGLFASAESRRYVVFRAKAEPLAGEASALASEQKILVKGSGHFEVSNMRRYLAEVPVVFWTTELADHVLAAKVRAPNILGVGVPKVEKGWWYIFLDPARVREIVPGELCFGTRCREAVLLQHETAKGLEAVYISCDGGEQQRTVLAELQAKASAACPRRSSSVEDPAS